MEAIVARKDGYVSESLLGAHPKQPAHNFLGRRSGHFARPKRDRASNRITARRVCARLQVSKYFERARVVHVRTWSQPLCRRRSSEDWLPDRLERRKLSRRALAPILGERSACTVFPPSQPRISLV